MMAYSALPVMVTRPSRPLFFSCLGSRWRLATANDASTIPGPLYDRMDVIELPSYTRTEKFNIAKRHLLPKQLKNNGISR